MKKSTIITALTTIMMMAVTPAFAQEENGFKKFNVREDFTENGFQWFHDAELLAAGDKEKSNAMTIGWGGIGTLWGRTALTVYVAEKRYTKEFMDKAEYFTVMTFDVEESKVLNYMGTKSGRDGDKALAAEYRAEIMQMRRDRNREGLQVLQDKLAAQAESKVGKSGLTDEQLKIYSTVGGTPHLDGQYTVFGEVEEGLDVVEMIQGTATGRADRPVDDIEMRMTIIE